METRYYTKPSWIFGVNLSHFTATLWIILAVFLFAIYYDCLWWQMQCPSKWYLNREMYISLCLKISGHLSEQCFYSFVCFNPPFCMTHCMLSVSVPAVTTNYLEVLQAHSFCSWNPTVRCEPQSDSSRLVCLCLKNWINYMTYILLIIQK